MYDVLICVYLYTCGMYTRDRGRVRRSGKASIHVGECVAYGIYVWDIYMYDICMWMIQGI